MLPIALLLLLVLLILEYRNVKKQPALYIDNGQSNDRVFRSAKYNISAKPDVIVDRHTIVEKKSRKHGLYDSDIKQMMATALAVRSTYPIKHGYLDTGDQRHDINLDYSDAMLFDKIKTEYQQAILISKGKTPEAKPAKNKCASCQFKQRCEYSLAVS